MKGDKNVDIEALKDIANKLRIDSIVATNASKSGWVHNLTYFYCRFIEGLMKVIINYYKLIGILCHLFE